MSAKVTICLGNILEGGADLTILPASAKGTISSSCKTWVDIYGLKSPPFEKRASLGQLSDCFQFPDDSISKYYCYAYSVYNDQTTAENIKKISENIGVLSNEYSNYKVIQTPLLGTGAGGLNNEVATKALITGFVNTCKSDAQLFIFVYDSERHKELQKHLKGFIERLKDALQLKLTFMGAGIDFKKLKK